MGFASIQRLLASWTIRHAAMLLTLAVAVGCAGGAGYGQDPLPAEHHTAPPEKEREIAVEATPDEPLEPEPPPWQETFDDLPPDIRTMVWATVEDPPPDHFDGITAEREGQHYLVSDEENPQMFAEVLDGLGGALLGVGTDQMYLYIGWQRPALAFLTDYDPYVKAMHLAHMAVFAHCPGVDCFRAVWTDSDREEGVAAIESFWSGDRVSQDEIDGAVRLFRRLDDRMETRFELLDENLAEMGVRGYLNDEEQYAFVRQMILAGRVRPVQANLLLEGAFVEIGALCAELGVPVRAMYVSNAETYWSFTDEYRAMVRSLPVDDASVFLRTFPSGSRNGDYTYAVQSWQGTLNWLGSQDVEDVWDLATYDRAIANHAVPLVVLEDAPPSE